VKERTQAGNAEISDRNTPFSSCVTDDLEVLEPTNFTYALYKWYEPSTLERWLYSCESIRDITFETAQLILMKMT
jgi:hypothetical protein